MNIITRKNHKQSGFTLIELMIVVAIIGILSSTAIPIMDDYTNRSRANSAVGSISSYQSTITECLVLNSATSCDGGQNGIPANIAAPGVINYIDVLTVTDGVISMTMEATDLVGTNMSLTVTPVRNNGVFSWNRAGTGCDDRRGIKC